MKLALVLLAFMTACVTSFPEDRSARPAQEVPEAFLVREGVELRAARRTGGCRGPMVDPRDRTEIILARSQGERGDYAVPTGRYGVGRNELLRLDCATGEVIGIVRGE